MHRYEGHKHNPYGAELITYEAPQLMEIALLVQEVQQEQVFFLKSEFLE